ncbi:hypothetical protein ElyMa_005545800 [Elysia marginata]|uniref:Uncharacterized protein n=1 Tax=Elysia marginata TaxID=1093978 RepID=A0AAV4EZ05_9GAST|nr:hypothetical protein ElyMa_005545800 [Elysia marginata]
MQLKHRRRAALVAVNDDRWAEVSSALEAILISSRSLTGQMSLFGDGERRQKTWGIMDRPLNTQNSPRAGDERLRMKFTCSLLRSYYISLKYLT